MIFACGALNWQIHFMDRLMRESHETVTTQPSAREQMAGPDQQIIERVSRPSLHVFRRTFSASNLSGEVKKL
jgi:hypothetical protein